MSYYVSESLDPSSFCIFDNDRTLRSSKDMVFEEHVDYKEMRKIVKEFKKASTGAYRKWRTNDTAENIANGIVTTVMYCEGLNFKAHTSSPVRVEANLARPGAESASYCINLPGDGGNCLEPPENWEFNEEDRLTFSRVDLWVTSSLALFKADDGCSSGGDPKLHWRYMDEDKKHAFVEQNYPDTDSDKELTWIQSLDDHTTRTVEQIEATDKEHLGKSKKPSTSSMDSKRSEKECQSQLQSSTCMSVKGVFRFAKQKKQQSLSTQMKWSEDDTSGGMHRDRASSSRLPEGHSLFRHRRQIMAHSSSHFSQLQELLDSHQGNSSPWHSDGGSEDNHTQRARVRDPAKNLQGAPPKGIEPVEAGLQKEETSSSTEPKGKGWPTPREYSPAPSGDLPPISRASRRRSPRVEGSSPKNISFQRQEHLAAPPSTFRESMTLEHKESMAAAASCGRKEAIREFKSRLPPLRVNSRHGSLTNSEATEKASHEASQAEEDRPTIMEGSASMEDRVSSFRNQWRSRRLSLQSATGVEGFDEGSSVGTDDLVEDALFLAQLLKSKDRSWVVKQIKASLALRRSQSQLQLNNQATADHSSFLEDRLTLLPEGVRFHRSSSAPTEKSLQVDIMRGGRARSRLQRKSGKSRSSSAGSVQEILSNRGKEGHWIDLRESHATPNCVFDIQSSSPEGVSL